MTKVHYNYSTACICLVIIQNKYTFIPYTYKEYTLINDCQHAGITMTILNVSEMEVNMQHYISRAMYKWPF